MSADPAELAARYERFCAEFLRPLLLGGEARTGRPLPPGDLTYFAAASPTDPELAATLEDGVRAAAHELAPLPPAPWSDRGTTALLMAVHDLALLTDPALDRLFARRTRPTVARWVRALVDGMDTPQTRGEALRRHVWLDRFLALRRPDTVVRNWAYTYRFYGRPPPANVVALPRLRRVRQERSEVALVDLVDADEELGLRELLDALVRRSPLTPILRWRRYRPLRLGAAALACLSDPALRSGLARALARETDAELPDALGRAIRELHAQGAPPEHLAVALAFLADVQLVGLVAPSPGGGPADPPKAATDDARLFAAVLPALLDAGDPFGHLGGLTEPDRLHALVGVERRRARGGEGALAFLRSLVDRAAPLPVSSPAA